MRFVLFLLLVLPFLVDDPVLRHRFTALFVAALVLYAAWQAARWLSGAPLFDRQTDLARELAGFARLLSDQGEQPGGVLRVGRATVISGSWRGRPFRCTVDPRGAILWDLVVTGAPVALLVSRPGWLGPLGETRCERGGNLVAWGQPGPRRAEALAVELVDTRALDRVQLAGDALHGRGPLRRGTLTPLRLLQVLRDLGGIAELVAPRGSTGRLGPRPSDSGVARGPERS